MTYRTAPSTQAPLPAPAGDEDQHFPEGVKYETTAKGPRWTIRIRRDTCLDDAALVEERIERGTQI